MPCTEEEQLLWPHPSKLKISAPIKHRAGKALPCPTGREPLPIVAQSGVGAGGYCHILWPVPCALALQCDAVDTGEGGAAALPQPQAPEHREAAQVVPSMEGEREVSPTLLNGWGFWRQVRQPATFRSGTNRKMHVLANAPSSTEDVFRYQNYNF